MRALLLIPAFFWVAIPPAQAQFEISGPTRPPGPGDVKIADPMPPGEVVRDTPLSDRLQICNLSPIPFDSGITVDRGPFRVFNIFDLFKRNFGDPQEEEEPQVSDGSGPSTGILSGDIGVRRRAWERRDLERRLDRCTALRDNIIWETAAGERIPYPDWTSEQKTRLQEIFKALVRGDEDLGLQCPDPLGSLSDNKLTFFSAAEAFDVFAAHVAHALYLEAEGKVPWRLSTFPGEEIREITASYRYHHIITASANQYYPSHIQPGRDFQAEATAQDYGILNCDPRVGYHFLKGLGPEFPQVSPELDFPYQTEDLIAATHEETLINIHGWLNSWVVHGPSLRKVSRMELANNSTLQQRLRVRELNGYRGVHVIGGCHQGHHLIRDLARSVNIPLLATATAIYPPGVSQGNYRNIIHG
ncbi:MAG: hypothetical protein R3257_06900, partial [bacterium]|nr:hypothetical protein [bacterium]